MLTTTTPESLESFLSVNAGTTLRASVAMTPDPSPRARVYHTFLVLGTKRRRPVRAVKLRIGLAPTDAIDSWLQFDAVLRHYADAVRILDARARAAGGRVVAEHNDGLDDSAVPEIGTTDPELLVALDAAPY
jgi:hypothetical protein